ncbi:hypothetical protein ONS95_003940 [Cadophora gregata]|uniref:uncharacterized protein n=1 Tax=Cadophora gregata TaxID=51156 RepID=UPI0026DDA431|nr:uncharacterized protein ONS95_003940 [Cadophora gregata]KAK0107238.1 hypothetical protein ONS95_003940 [Cadophora gregata]KAK0116922.1 hypothetical protein ONS96_012767 [Cadophora gregata f. sp. sojae]
MDDSPTTGLPPSFPTSIFGDDDFPTFLTSFTKKSSSTSTTDTSTSSQITPVLNTMTSYTPSPLGPASSPTPSGYPGSDDGNDSLFERLENGTKAAVGVAITIGVIVIVALSVWYCCGCCGLRARRRKRREGSRAQDISSQPPVPLNTMSPSHAPPAGDAPPQYEEAVPPQHQHIAGGARHVRQEEDDAVISDGKTPLSEIPFEDVVLDHSPSEGSSRSFSERHHGLGGDTRGHTNT